MKYAHSDKNGQLLGWYDEDIHALIPTPNIEVSDEAWQNAIDNNHNKVNTDGTTKLYDFRTEDEKAKDELESNIRKAKAYLASTDFKMTVDYFATLDEQEQAELTYNRAKARTFLKEQGL